MLSKLSDEQIIKDLPKILFGGHGCRKCKFYSLGGDERCGVKGCIIARNALDLINRLKAENKNITEKFNCQQKVYSDLHHIIQSHAEELKTAKAEAYKEFAERLKEKAMTHFDYNKWIEIDVIDDTLKEMAGEG